MGRCTTRVVVRRVYYKIYVSGSTNLMSIYIYTIHSIYIYIYDQTYGREQQLDRRADQTVNLVRWRRTVAGQRNCSFCYLYYYYCIRIFILDEENVKTL